MHSPYPYLIPRVNGSPLAPSWLAPNQKAISSQSRLKNEKYTVFAKVKHGGLYVEIFGQSSVHINKALRCENID